MNRVFSCISAAVVVGAATAGTALAATINVPADQPTIQDAIDNAQPGDLIQLDVTAGPFSRFAVPADLTDLTVRGVDFDTAFPDLPFTPTDSDFKVDARDYVDNSRPDCDAEPEEGGGGGGGRSVGLPVIDLAFGESLIIEGDNFKLEGVRVWNGRALSDGNGNNTDLGGGADILANGVVIEFTCWQNNRADVNGGAIWVSDNSDVLVTNSVFNENEAFFGGAIQVGLNASAQIVDSDFTNNTALGGSGGAIDADFAELLEIDSSCFINNEASRSLSVSGGQGGAISLFGTTTNIENSEFCGNTARLGGGAITNFDSTVDSLFNTFWNNTSQSGGGIEAFGSPSAGSPDDALFTFRNTAIALTRLVNSSAVTFPFSASYSYSDQVESGTPFPSFAGVADLGGNLSEANDLPAGVTSISLFENAAACNLKLNRFIPDGVGGLTDNILIDSGDSRAGSLINSDPPFFLLDPTDIVNLGVYCGNLPFFDKHDDCRAVDVVDNPSTADVDEGVENTGVDIFNRNCTCDAVDIGAKEFQQEPFPEIVTTCLGDSNFSGFVDIEDLFVTLEFFHKTCGVESPFPGS